MSSPSRYVIDPLIYEDQNNKAPSKSQPATLPAPSNLIPPSTQPATGWTPLVSRTISADMNSYNSTPSSKIFSSLYKQNGAPGASSGADEEYPGLSLTPFLNHNLSLMAHPNSAGHYSAHGGFTPFCDKSIHLGDFFMDSPIRTPSKLETITPSRFNIQADSSVRSSEPLLNVASSRKRLDPAFGSKPAHKHDDEFADEFVTPSKKSAAKNPARTPSRAISDGQTLQTPLVAHAVSSPSTVIMSSAVKSPQHDKENPPASPTPLKDQEAKIDTSEPVMGIFSERKRASDEPRAARPKKQVAGTSRFQIVLTDVHTLMNSKKKRAEKSKKRRNTGPVQSNSSQAHVQTQTSHVGPSRSQASGPGHGQGAVLGHGPTRGGTGAPEKDPYTGCPDYNTSINNSREFSNFSNTSREFSLNSIHTNMTSIDHASFELMHAGSVSTPNKFLLDNSFERTSPVGRKPAHKQDYMAPPKHAFGRPPYGSFPEPMNMSMSTPQKYMPPSSGPYLQDSVSPSSREMAYLYSRMHQVPESMYPGKKG